MAVAVERGRRGDVLAQHAGENQVEAVAHRRLLGAEVDL
jgi:hypothetical protein